MLKEFKEFAMRGNVLDLAIGLVLGAAFGTIVTSFVNDILMPPIGLALGKVDFSNLFLDLSGRGFNTLAEAKAAGTPTINFGVFLNAVINFLIVAFAIFLLVRQINKVKTKPEVTLTSKPCSFCFSVIPIQAKRCPNCTSTLSPA
jgi:large conductance mechanosensitive channel